MIPSFDDSRVVRLSSSGNTEFHFTKALSPEALATIACYRRTVRRNYSPFSLAFRPIAHQLAKRINKINEKRKSFSAITSPNAISLVGVFFSLIALVINICRPPSSSYLINGIPCLLLLVSRLCDCLDGAMADYFPTADALGYLVDSYMDMISMVIYVFCFIAAHEYPTEHWSTGLHFLSVSLFMWLPALSATAEALLRRATILSTIHHLAADSLIVLLFLRGDIQLRMFTYGSLSLLPVYLFSAAYLAIATIRGRMKMKEEKSAEEETVPAVVGDVEQPGEGHEAHTRQSVFSAAISNVVPISGSESVRIGVGFLGTCLWVSAFVAICSFQDLSKNFFWCVLALVSTAFLALVRASVATISGHVTPAIQAIHVLIVLCALPPLFKVDLSFLRVTQIIVSVMCCLSSIWMMIWTTGAVVQHAHIGHPFAPAPDHTS